MGIASPILAIKSNPRGQSQLDGILSSTSNCDANGAEAQQTSYDRLPGVPCIALSAGKALSCTSQQWNEGRYLVSDIVYIGQHHSRFCIRFFAKGEEEPRLQFTVGLVPHLPTRLALSFKYLNAQTLFLSRSPGILKTTCLGQRIERHEIARVETEIEDTGHPQMALCRHLD